MSFIDAGRFVGAMARVRALAEMNGPDIDLSSPDMVPPVSTLALCSSLLDARRLEHLSLQYTRFRAAIGLQAQAPPVKAKPGATESPKGVKK